MAHASGLDVEISNPDVSVVSVQGPKAIDVLAAACDAGAPEAFNYFSVRQVEMGAQPVVISRTGWTGELGFEVYLARLHRDGPALWRHIEQKGSPFDIIPGGLDAMDIRRIEAGILLCGADMDVSINPYQAGLGDFVDMGKPEFVGKAALQSADRALLVHGLTCADDEPVPGGGLFLGDELIGRVTAAAFSPYLESGIAIVRLHQGCNDNLVELEIETRRDSRAPANLVRLPMYDEEHRIVRGLDTSTP